MRQKYGYVPGSSNRNEKVVPSWGSDPSNVFSGCFGVPDVTVWSIRSRSVHVTVVPLVTCNGLGSNMKVRTITSSFDVLGDVAAAVSSAFALHADNRPMESAAAIRAGRARPFVVGSRKSNTQTVRGQVVVGLNRHVDVTDDVAVDDVSATDPVFDV
jgi:hypothetical protein